MQLYTKNDDETNSGRKIGFVTMVTPIVT